MQYPVAALRTQCLKHAVLSVCEHDLQSVDRHSASPVQMKLGDGWLHCISSPSCGEPSARGQSDTIVESTHVVVWKIVKSRASVDVWRVKMCKGDVFCSPKERRRVFGGRPREGLVHESQRKRA